MGKEARWARILATLFICDILLVPCLTAIQAYWSPPNIFAVLPCLRLEQEPGPQVHEAAAAIEPWLDRFDAVLIGPGLGRDPLTLATVAEVSDVNYFLEPWTDAD